jgi:hypothetical protein
VIISDNKQEVKKDDGN